ncbi:PAS domain-containing protein [Deinococcus pimensis]|uniref:PAS domain-containing protein n=1 Tax=Deinococcus pimensis TaxID=309888 RepID=UPI000483F586|nr:PAS domain-containing protein [Deinococcus pimensis]
MPFTLESSLQYATWIEQHLRGGAFGESVGRVTRLAARSFGVDACVVNVVSEGRVWSEVVTGGSAVTVRAGELVCPLVVEGARSVVVPDTLEDERVRSLPMVRAGALRFYAGVPLTLPTGGAFGTLCLLDVRPRVFGDEDLAALREFAALVMADVEAHFALARSEHARAQVQQLLSWAPFAVHVTDPRGRVVFWNEAARRMYGYEADEVLGEALPAALGSRTEVVTRPPGPSRPRQVTRRRRDVSRLVVLTAAAEVLDVNGAPVGVLDVSVDVTDRVRNELRLKLLEGVVAQAQDGVMVCRFDTPARGHVVVEYANAALLAQLGARAGEVVGRRLDDVLSGRLPEGECAALVEAVTAGTPELRRMSMRVSGVGRPFEVSLTPIVTEGDDLGLCVGIVRSLSVRN